MLRSREIDPLALAQLAAWERYARNWPMWFSEKQTGWHLSCSVCGQTVTPLTINGVPYTLTADIVLAAMVAHLRIVHAEIEREVYRDGGIDGRQDTAATADSGSASYRDSGNPDSG